MSDTFKASHTSINTRGNAAHKINSEKKQSIISEENCSAQDEQNNEYISQVQQLFIRLTQEIEEKNPKNVIYFVVDFLCKNYPEHLNGFATLWNADPELECERATVVEFFKSQKLSSEIASHFTNAGFDTLETLCTLTNDSLDEIEKFNQTRWLPGHKIRLQQIFADIANRVKAFREEKDNILRTLKNKKYCNHQTLITKPNLISYPNQDEMGLPTYESTSYHCDYLSSPSYYKLNYIPADFTPAITERHFTTPGTYDYYYRDYQKAPFISNSLNNSNF